MVAVKLKKDRYGIGEDCIIERNITGRGRGNPHSSPSALSAPRALDTDPERAGKPEVLCPRCTTAEIEENTRDRSRNTHYREAYWKKAPFRVVIPLRKETGRETSVRKPRKMLHFPNGRSPISGWSGNGVHAHAKVSGTERFFKIGEELRFLNLQYRSVLAAPVFGGILQVVFLRCLSGGPF